ncbi:MAG TPA: crosslink repair DNA glycosylase YcaQ family protein, partial [Ilumatobacter sp.]|nr:crosslink repair DNA glycosylase YcaQ family protein [Ilumatobacter sp.]
MLRVTDDHRRARIARRHGLHPDHRYDTILAATSAMTALHATEPATPHLSLHARVRGLTVEDVDAALYEERSLVRTMAMRRTLFVVTRDVLPAVAGCAGRRVAEAERRRLAKEAGVLEGLLGADWITAASEQI